MEFQVDDYLTEALRFQLRSGFLDQDALLSVSCDIIGDYCEQEDMTPPDITVIRRVLEDVCANLP